MKRLAAVILAAALAVSCCAAASAQEDGQLTRAGAVEEIVRTLYLTGGDTAFTFEGYYCMHASGYVHFVPDEALLRDGYPLYCELYQSVERPGFSDMSLEEENLSVYVTLAKAMGIIDGYDDDTFRPDRPATYDEAVKMLVCAFGFGGMADTRGGYPEGYIKTAEETGITEGIGFNGGDAVTQEAFRAMLKNAVTSNSTIQSQMTIFTPPATPVECAGAYAEAVKNRNGALQYALLNDELKETTREGFESFGWVTGVSSPWVSGYDIAETSDLEFEITFHYATSTGPGPDGVIKVLTQEVNGVYRIAELD